MEGSSGPGRYGVDPRLDAEIEELERRIETLKEERSAARRRRGPERIEDFEVGTVEGQRHLSELFGEHDDLLLVHNMGRACAYCTLASDPTREVARALGFATEGGVSLPGASALRRPTDGALTPSGRAEFGPGDDYCAVWPLFDLLPGGSGGWVPKI